MARNKGSQTNKNNSQPLVYLNGRIQDDDGSGNGTPVNESVYGDIHQFFAKLMSLAGLIYNEIPENELTGYQLIDAARALATKNDYILDLVDTTPVDADRILIPLKLGKLTPGEFFICKATVDKVGQTKLIGSDNVVRTAVFDGDFLTGEYVRVENTSTTILVKRLVEFSNLQTIALELAFLQAATTAESLDGLINTKAETPLTSALTFVERVVGSLSDQSLASLIRNGLYPKEHFAIVESLDSSAMRYGTFDPEDVGSTTPVGTVVASTGNFVSAVINDNDNNGFGGESYTLTLDTPMTNTNYSLDISVESLGSETVDNNIQGLVWQKISPSQFKVFIQENTGSSVQSLRVHITVRQR